MPPLPPYESHTFTKSTLPIAAIAGGVPSFRLFDHADLGPDHPRSASVSQDTINIDQIRAKHGMPSLVGYKSGVAHPTS
jgi:hypothetical protein